MKTVKILLIGALCVFFTSCDKDEDNVEIGNGNNKLSNGQIEIKVEPNNSKKVAFYATAKKITIDWGDGNIDELTPNGIGRDFTHEYTDQNLKSILINTESLTNFSIGYGSYYNNGTYRELWFGDCPELEEISCGGNQLTVLKIKGCTALTSLRCTDNQLTSSALNSLFNSLPKTTNGKIDFSSNPGTQDCDISIAEEKGWNKFGDNPFSDPTIEVKLTAGSGSAIDLTNKQEITAYETGEKLDFAIRFSMGDDKLTSIKIVAKIGTDTFTEVDSTLVEMLKCLIISTGPLLEITKRLLHSHQLIRKTELQVSL